MRLVCKLTLAMLVAICAVLAAHGYLRVKREVLLIESDMKRDHYKMGEAFATAVAELWRVGGEAEALSLIDDTNRARKEVLIRWVRLDAPADDPDRPGLDPKELEAVHDGHEVVRAHADQDGVERLYTYIPVPLGGTPTSAIELSESLAPARQYTRTSVIRILVTTLILVAICTLLSTLIGAWFVGRPIRSLIEQARRVGSGDFSRRLDLHQRDEIGDLAAEMNAMSSRLRETNEKLSAETAARIAIIEQLRHADRLATVGKLASGVAHELGTPLNVVSGQAKMILSEEVSGNEIMKSARAIAEQADRMTSIIRQLLDFARRRSPKKELQDLRLLTQQTTALLAPLATKRNVALHLDGQDVPAMVEVDNGQFQQALMNLVINGIQAMQRGGNITVGITHARACPPVDNGGAETDCVRLFVQDEGDGIPPSAIEHVFEPFFTTKGVGEGTGLGLSVSYGIVREHGGWIGVETEVGKGSCFAIYLPAAEHACGAGYSS